MPDSRHDSRAQPTQDERMAERLGEMYDGDDEDDEDDEDGEDDEP